MVIKTLESGTGMQLFKKNKKHYHSSICLQVVEEVRKSLNQPKKQKKAHT
jgi:hypothetical protein